MNQGDLVTHKGDTVVMVILGGVRASKGPHDYTSVTCLWFDGEEKHQAAFPVDDIAPTSAKPSSELAAYIAEREAEARIRMMRGGR